MALLAVLASIIRTRALSAAEIGAAVSRSMKSAECLFGDLGSGYQRGVPEVEIVPVVCREVIRARASGVVSAAGMWGAV